jgi:hypothetical protein
MKCKLVSGAILFVCAASMVCARAQEQQETIPAPHALVELTVNKRVYGRREPVTFRAILVNDDPRGFYISKSFYGAGGGVAGFYVYGVQLSGKRRGEKCSAMAGDVFRLAAESRSPDQVLKEDFLPIQPGGFVGYEGAYQPCAISSPGEYEIWVEYETGDLSQGLVRTLVVHRQRVLDGKFKSNPVKFWIR